MTPRKESAFKTLLIGLGTAAVIAVCSAAFASKENVVDHRADQARTDQNVQRILDVLCEGQPAKRACQ